jgi:glyoxylase-like metal-dependent hydrolase (beta-lactamase superfamily II)
MAARKTEGFSNNSQFGAGFKTDNILIRRLVIGAYVVNTYLVACPETFEGVVIDPAGEPEKIIRKVEKEKIRIKYILNTHGHADHVAANKNLRKYFSVPVLMHEADDRFFSDAEVRIRSERELGLAPPDSADQTLKDGDTVSVGKLKIKVIHTPGHTPGSCCFFADGNLFTGDTLFVGSVGRSDLVGGSLNTLIQSLKNKLTVLPEDTVVWPGHDYGDSPTSTIGREMKENPYITEFILDD